MEDLFKYNLQFFAEESDDTNTDDSNNSDNSDDIDVKALADLLSEKDNELKAMQKELEELKKANAKMVVQMSTGNKVTAKSFEENLLELVGATPRKE